MDRQRVERRDGQTGRITDTYTHTHILYIYIYIERERERERKKLDGCITQAR